MTKDLTTKSNWKFSLAFWIANGVELLERAAYYGVFIGITLFLTDVVGFTDIEAGWIGGFFSAGLYFLPTFAGAYADKIGFRNAIILAFSLLSVGYFGLGILPYKATVIPSLIIVMFGGSFIKSVISGTVAKESEANNRARAYSIFYAIVNIGAFFGKTIAYPIRLNLGLEYINLYAAALTFLALITVTLFYKNTNRAGEGKSMKEIWDGFIIVLNNSRLLILIIIITGFWIIQHQLYAAMPKFVIRLVGESASPEWIANVNPFVVVTTVMLVTHFMRNFKPLTSMTVGMFLMPVSAFFMSLGPALQLYSGDNIAFGFFSLHPITAMMIAGIIIQAFAETFISPRFLEYFSLQAPKGEEGLYLGFSHLHSFLANLLGFISSGYLLDAYCPDPKTLSAEQLPTAYEHAHYIWYFYAAIGFTAAIALVIYGRIYKVKDSKKDNEEQQTVK